MNTLIQLVCAYELDRSNKPITTISDMQYAIGVAVEVANHDLKPTKTR